MSHGSTIGGDEIFGHHLLDLYRDDEALVQRQLELFRSDKDWRDKWKNVQLIRERYERIYRTGVSGDVPYANMMQGLVEEVTASIAPNVPDVRLVSRNPIDPRLPEIVRWIMDQLLRQEEEAANVVVHSALADNGFYDINHFAVRDAAIYGAGYIFQDEDYTGNPSKDSRLNELVEQYKRGEISESELDKYFGTRGRMNCEWVPFDQVYFEYGRRRFDDTMTRVTLLHEVDVFALAAEFADRAEDILDGAGYAYDDISTRSEAPSDLTGMFDNPSGAAAGGGSGSGTSDNEGSTLAEKFTQVITTYEVVEIAYPVGDDLLPEHVMVRTRIASGGVLLDKDIITRDGEPLEWDMFERELEDYEANHDSNLEDRDDEADTYRQIPDPEVYDTVAGDPSLPVTPYYIRHSQNHPYGRSLVEQMMSTEDAFNDVTAILMAYAERNLQNSKIFIQKSRLAPGEGQRIQSFLDDPRAEVFEVEGNDPYSEGQDDIRRMVMPFPNMVKEPPAQLMVLADRLMGQFQKISGMADQSAIGRTRSAAGKRAQLAVNDGSKMMPVEIIASARERIYLKAYKIFQALVQEEEAVDFLLQGGIGGTIIFNQKVDEFVPILDEFGDIMADPRLRTKDNRLGLFQSNYKFDINSNRRSMRAEADGRGVLPHDPIALQALAQAWQAAGYITEDTGRRLALPPKVRQEDDGNRTKTSFIQQKMQELEALKQQLMESGQDLSQPAPVQIMNDQGALPQAPVGSTAMSDASLPAPSLG